MRFTRRQIQPYVEKSTRDLKRAYGWLVATGWFSGFVIGVFAGYVGGLLQRM